MTIESIVSSDGDNVTIRVIGRFDFSMLRNFRSAYTNNNDKPMIVTVDLSQTEYMDSSALGMLLVLREFSEKMGGTVILYKPSDGIKDILDIAKFDSFFISRK